MARGINKVIIVGNLGNDPEVRAFPDGTATANVSVATSESWKDRNTGEQKEATEWHRVVFRARLAEVVRDYLKKGSKIYVEGKLRTRKWQGQDGKDNYTTEILCSNMQMLDSRETNNTQANAAQAAPQASGRAAPPPNQPMGTHQQQPAQAKQFDQFDDDIPF